MEEFEDEEVFDLPAAGLLDQNIVPVLLLSLEKLVQRDHIATFDLQKSRCHLTS